MARAPEPGDGCRPGGTCPTCNPPPDYCPACGEVQVENPGELCAGCTDDGRDEPIVGANYGEE